MLKNLIVLPDGTEIFSGNSRGNAIISAKFTQVVNDGTELAPGSVCSNELEVKLFSPGGNLTIAAGEEITYYKVYENGAREKIGLFTMEKPTRPGSGTYKFIAYDRVSWLDKDLTSWLSGLTGWPYAVSDFAEMVCSACGLSLVPSDLPNGSYLIEKFSASNITGRKLLQWVGQIVCRFARATADGLIEFTWYTDKGATILSNGSNPYFGLSYEDYNVAQIQKVQIQASEEDIGTIYPDGSEEPLNTYKVTGNFLLTAETADDLVGVAQTIYEQLQGITYTPCKFSMMANTSINAGDIVRIIDRNGVTITTFVMQKTQNGQKDMLECTGSPRRDSSTATNNLSLKALSGKVLNIQKSVDGLIVENKDTAGKLAGLYLNIESITARVSDTEKGLAEISLRAGEVDVTVEKKSHATVSTSDHSFAIVDNDLVLTYEGDAPGYYIDDEGNLILSYTGDEPDIRIENGELITAEESLETVVNEGTLTTKINAEGYWESKFVKDNEVISSLYFDFANSRFVFNGHLEATSGQLGNLTIIDKLYFGGNKSYYIDANKDNSDWYIYLPNFAVNDTTVQIGDCSVVDGKLKVPAANIEGTLEAGNIDTANLSVKAANISGQLTVDQIDATGLTAVDVNLTGTITATGGKIGNWNIGLKQIYSGADTLFDGIALYSDPYYEDGVETIVTLTPEKVYVERREEGAYIPDYASWYKVIIAANS